LRVLVGAFTSQRLAEAARITRKKKGKKEASLSFSDLNLLLFGRARQGKKREKKRKCVFLIALFVSGERAGMKEENTPAAQQIFRLHMPTACRHRSRSARGERREVSSIRFRILGHPEGEDDADDRSADRRGEGGKRGGEADIFFPSFFIFTGGSPFHYFLLSPHLFRRKEEEIFLHHLYRQGIEERGKKKVFHSFSRLRRREKERRSRRFPLRGQRDQRGGGSLHLLLLAYQTSKVRRGGGGDGGVLKRDEIVHALSQPRRPRHDRNEGKKEKGDSHQEEKKRESTLSPSSYFALKEGKEDPPPSSFLLRERRGKKGKGLPLFLFPSYFIPAAARREGERENAFNSDVLTLLFDISSKGLDRQES